MPKDFEPDWTGGSWEQPTSRYHTGDIISRDLEREIAISRRGRKLRRILGRILLVTTALALMATLVAGGVLLLADGDTDTPKIPSTTYPWSDGSGGGSVPESGDIEMVKPTIPRADLQDEGILTLAPSAGAPLAPQANYQKNLPSITLITAEGESGYGEGTGIVLTEDGYIVTNAHVISDSHRATVTLFDDTVYEAELVGWDGDEDIAVLKIDAEGLTPAVFGSSELVQVGDLAYAIGNPLGAEYRSTFSDGMISAVNRYLDIDGIFMSLIQTTAAINMGNSGGALLNESGQVIGITTIKIMSDVDTIESMGFAIPSDRVQRVVNCLVQGISVETPALGVTIIPTDSPVRGLFVDSVTADSPAELAGVLKGDIIVAANGTPIYQNNDMAQVKDQLLVGDTIRLLINRAGETMELDLVLMEYDDVYPDG